MADLTLDTSGFVEGPPAGVRTKRIYWPDLSPFEQGYTWAALRELDCRRMAYYRAAPGRAVPVRLGFSFLAAEALEAIRKDCAALSCDGLEHCDIEDGDHAWKVRQAGRWPDFPPLTPTLGDDGRVYLRASA